MNFNFPISLAKTLLLVFLFSAGFAQDQILKDSKSWVEPTTFKNDPLKLKVYTLNNGLTVMLSEDKNLSKTFGAVVVKAGGKTDPKDATGMAHYLEHMLFKGTQTMGTINYQKEKVHLDNITELYKKLGKTSDEEERATIQKQINMESKMAAKYAIPNEIDRLLSSIGATGVNAFTSNDMTVYHNAFPSNQMEKWLEIYSTRFQNPVFRLFQSELETVYEEKNRSEDNFVSKLITSFSSKFWKNHPYGQQTILGTTEHLKNPPLHTMYAYFNKYYVANNMALILSGNFNSEKVLPMIEKKFGKWKSAPLEPMKKYEEQPFNKREFYKERLSPIKLGLIGYRTPGIGHQDNAAIDVINNLLSNSEGSGTLDQLTNEGKLLGTQIYDQRFADYSANTVFFAPKLIGQKLEKAEGLVMEAINKIKTGDFSETQLKAVKLNMIKDYESKWENSEMRVYELATCFSSNLSWNYFIQYKNQIENLSKEDLIKIANKYFGENRMVLYSKMGFPKKEKLKKPGFEPVIPKNEVKSEFATHLQKIKSGKSVPNYVNFEKEIETTDISPLVHLKKTKNPFNSIFSLSLEFGVGRFSLPELYYFNSLTAYPMTKDMDATTFNNKFYEIGASISTSVTKDRFRIKLEGLDSRLDETIDLLNVYLKDFTTNEEKIKKVLEDIKSERKLGRNNPAELADAANEFVLYGNQSSYYQEFDKKKEKKLTPKMLLDAYQKAQTYELNISYTGNIDLKKLKSTLSSKIDFQKINQPQQPILFRKRTQNEKTVIYFLNDKKAIQSQISFYINGASYNIKQAPYIDAFNGYFGGDMSSLVFQEIREFRSLAYTAYARYFSPEKQGPNALFKGYIGCQGDKTIESIETMVSLINDMPQKKERIESIKNSLIEKSSVSRPPFRHLISAVDKWKRVGYTEDPNIQKRTTYEKLVFDDITSFNQKHLKNKPITIIIVGNSKKFNPDDLKKFGEVKILKKKSLFVN